MTDVINDAAEYGVEIIPARVEAGQPYWKAIRIHHLSPTENKYRHHLFLNALDENRKPVTGIIFVIKWDGGSDTALLERSHPDGGVSFPLWKWQICSVEIKGEPSDRVVNLRTDHPQEGDGNDMFRHSFAITYMRTIAQEAIQPAAGVIFGHIPDGGGHTIALIDSDNQQQTMLVGEDEQYRFANLKAGSYILQDLSDHRVIGPVFSNGEDRQQVDFFPPLPAGQIAAKFFLFGPLSQSTTKFYLSLLSDYLSQQGIPFGFDVTNAARAGHVYLVGEHPDSTIELLESSGCKITQLPTAPDALLDELGTS